MTPYPWLPTLADLVLRADAATARLVASRKADGTPTITLAVTPASGKPRTKAFSTIDGALCAALAGGFVGAVAATGTLLVHTEVGATMGSQFAVDEPHGRAWLGDWGWLRRVDLRDGRVTSLPLGHHPAVREMVGDGRGGVWLLADEDREAPTEGFRAPAGAVLRFVVLHCDGERIERRHTIECGREERVALCLSLSRADDGTLLIPRRGGFALVDASGAEVRTFAVDAMKYWGPRAALSPSGRRLAYTAGIGKLALVDLERDAEVVLELAMDDAMALVVHDDGVVDVSVGTPNWDFLRLDAGGRIAQVNHRAASYAASPDRRWVYSGGDAWTATEVATGALREGPIVGAARGPKLAVTGESLYLRTSRGVFQRYARALAAAGA